MSMSNKWLIGLGMALGVLVLLAVALTLATGGRRVTAYPADTPEGAVQRYLQALIVKDAELAYDFLSPDLRDQCPLADWLEQSRFAYSQLDDSEVTLQRALRVSDNEALVTVAIGRIEGPGLIDVRPRQFSYDQDFRLRKQSDGVWRFSQSPWPVYGCPTRPVPAKPLPAPDIAPLPSPSPLPTPQG